MASSSAGNSVFVGTETTRILIDAGLSKKQTLLRLASIGEEASNLDAIFITHEHCDHIAGLPALARGLKVPVFLTKRTAPMIDW
ncbi:MAG TPA: MBL fold metallo-hydrolase, partial [Bryobacteraceae bacterium]|nr:MBL fold metallo-hydrolase [Bryobacteraceae bacterium]